VEYLFRKDYKHTETAGMWIQELNSC